MCRVQSCYHENISVVVVVSFQGLSQEVVESIGSHPVQLKSKGLYGRPFQVSFTCVEATPVEAESG